MNELDDILVQLNRTRFHPKSDRWITLPGLRSESEFYDVDAVSHEVHSHASASNHLLSTVMTQLRKKSVSKKSKKDRIVEKSIGLAERVGLPAPK